MSQERRQRKAAREAVVSDKITPEPEVVYFTTPDHGAARPPETMVARLVREEGMGFAQLEIQTRQGWYPVYARESATGDAQPGRWHRQKPV